MAGGGNSDNKSTKSEPNVVPLCDILLVLLIIFMVVTPMIQKGANVKLPNIKNNQDQPEPGKNIEVYITKNGKISIVMPGEKPKMVADMEMNKNTFDNDMDKLSTMIDQYIEENSIEDKKILIKADKEVEYGLVIDVMNELRDAAIEVVGFVTEQSTS